MASVRSKLLIGWFRLSGRKQVFLDTTQFDKSIVASQRKQTSQPPANLRLRNRIEHTTIRGFQCVTFSPRSGGNGQRMLYLHGGAYVHSIESAHWRFISRLVHRLGCTVTAPVYPLAPDYHYDETQAVIAEAYDRHIAAAAPADQVVMGDSAGGAPWFWLAS